jgi:hypothetical protein
MTLFESESIRAFASGCPSTSTTRPVSGCKSGVSSIKTGVSLGCGVPDNKSGVTPATDVVSGRGATVAEQAAKKITSKLRNLFKCLETIVISKKSDKE